MPERESLRKNPKMTETGKQYQLERSKKNQSEVYDKILKQTVTIATYMESPVNHLVVRKRVR